MQVVIPTPLPPTHTCTDQLDEVFDTLCPMILLGIVLFITAIVVLALAPDSTVLCPQTICPPDKPYRRKS